MHPCTAYVRLSCLDIIVCMCEYVFDRLMSAVLCVCLCVSQHDVMTCSRMYSCGDIKIYGARIRDQHAEGESVESGAVVRSNLTHF